MRSALLFLSLATLAVSLGAAASAQVRWERLPDLYPGGDRFDGIAWLRGPAPDADTLLAFRSQPFRFDEATGTWEEVCSLPCFANDLLVTHRQTLVMGARSGPTNIDRSTDGGRTWVKDVARNYGAEVLFEAELAAFRDSLGGPAVFAGIGQVLRSLDDGAFHTWGPPRSALGDVASFAELGPSAEIPTGRLFAGLYNGVSSSEDAGETWRPTGLYASGGYVADALSVAPDPAHPYGGVVYASGRAFGPRRGIVARSEDGGATWEEVLTVVPGDYGLENPIIARALVVDDGRGGTEVWTSAATVVGPGPYPGVLLRLRGGAWEDVTAGGFGGEGVNEFAMARDGRLYAATGRGLWRTVEAVGRPWPAVSGEAGPPEPAGDLTLVVEPNPSAGRAAVRWRQASAGAARVSVLDARGREVLVVSEGYRPSGEHRIEVDASGLAPGAYVVRVVTPGGTASGRLSVVR